MAKSGQSRPSIECPSCGTRFMTAHSGGSPRVVQVECPKCSEEVVIDSQELGERSCPVALVGRARLELATP